MGRERRGSGKYIFHLVAGVMLLALSACASIMPRTCDDERYPHLQRVRQLIASGDYERAQHLIQETLESDPQGTNGDAALFDLALLSVDSDNPKKDYRKAHSIFSRLVREHPQSPLVDEAKIWIGVLESIEKTKKIDIEIEEKKKGIIR